MSSGFLLTGVDGTRRGDPPRRSPAPAGRSIPSSELRQWTQLDRQAWGWGFAAPTDAARWVRTEDGLVIFDGDPIPTSGTLAETARELLAHRADPNPTARVHGTLSGLYAVAVVGADGVGFVASDPIGMRYVYHREHAGRWAVGSRADVVADALGEPGRPAAKDAWTVCALAHNGDRPLARTGYRDVAVFEPGDHLAIAAAGQLQLVQGAPPWDRARSQDARTLEGLCEQTFDDLVASVQRITSFDAPTVDLTGGKDSRLVLAALLAAGLAHDLAYQTVGPPELPDVQVARRVAEAFGIEHSARRAVIDFDRPAPADELDAFVRATGGIVQAGEARPVPPDRSSEVRVTGGVGEVLRANAPRGAEWLATPAEDAVARLATPSRLGLATRDYALSLDEAAATAFETVCTRSDSPYDWDFDWQLQVRKRTRFGPLDDLQVTRRFLPLYTAHALDLAAAIGGPARAAELLHRYVMVRAAPRLASLDFAEFSWRADALHQVGRGLHVPVTRGLPAPSAPPGGSASATPSSSPWSTTRVRRGVLELARRAWRKARRVVGRSRGGPTPSGSSPNIAAPPTSPPSSSTSPSSGASVSSPPSGSRSSPPSSPPSPSRSPSSSPSRSLTETSPSPRPAAGPARSLYAAIHGDLRPLRRAAYAEALADRANPAWDLLDRPRVLDAFGRYGELTPPERRELLGAITAAVWLGST